MKVWFSSADNAFNKSSTAAAEVVGNGSHRWVELPATGHPTL